MLGTSLFDELSLRNALTVRPRGLEIPPEDRLAEQQSILSEIGGTALSSIAKAGNTLDTFGGMVRNLVGGENPLAPLGAITTSEGRLSGEDLAKQWGLIDENTHWLPKFLAGLGVEVAFDPLTYGTLGLSAIGKAGRLAKKAGLLGDTLKLSEMASTKLGRQVGKRVGAMNLSLDELLRSVPDRKAAEAALAAANKGKALGADLLSEPLSSAARLRVPFTDMEVGLGRAGGLGEMLPGALDKLGGFARWSKLGRAASAVFSHRAGGAWNPEVQRASQHLSYAEDAALAASKGEAMRAFQKITEAGIPEDQANRLLRSMVEWGGDPASLSAADYPNWAAHFRELQNLKAPQRAALEEAVGLMRGAKDTSWKRLQDLGHNAGDLMDREIEHFPRYAAQSAQATDPWFTHLFSSGMDSMKARRDFLRNFREGTTGIEALASDPARAAAKGRNARALHIQQNYLEPIDQAQYQQWMQTDPKRARQMVVDRFDQAAKISDWVAQRGQGPVYGGLWENYARYLMQAGERAERAGALQELIARGKNLQPLLAASATNRLTPVKEVLLKGGFGADDVVNQEAINRIATLAGIKNPADVLNYGVPKEIADEATKLMRLPTAGDTAKPMLGLVDSINAAWKTVNTGVNPAFHFRNRVSGVVQNFLNGMFDPRVENAASKLLRNGAAIKGAEAWEPIARILTERKMAKTPENAMKVIQEMAFANDIIGPYHGASLDSLNDVFGQLAQTIPGAAPMKRREIFKPLLEKDRWTKDFGKMRGVAGAEETGNAIVKTGELAGYYVESMNRLAPFLTLLKKGWDPAAAAARVKSAHVDYTGRAWSAAERSVLTRLFPFYKFGKGQAGHVLEELLAHPGGGTAQALRATSNLQGKEILPEYVGQGLAIPLAPGPSGDPRYLSSLGLMHEQDPFSYFGGGFTGAMQELGSRLNPLVKWPIETITGESLFQRGPGGGRELSDMDPLVGRIASNLAGEKEPYKAWLGSVPLTRGVESFLANFGFPRQLSALRTATDPRKEWYTKILNTMTGVRISDVSEKAMDARIRELAAQALQDTGFGKEFVKPYIPDYVQATMAPDVRARTLAIEDILTTLAKRATARKEGSAVPPLGALYGM